MEEPLKLWIRYHFFYSDLIFTLIFSDSIMNGLLEFSCKLNVQY